MPKCGQTTILEGWRRWLCALRRDVDKGIYRPTHPWLAGFYGALVWLAWRRLCGCCWLRWFLWKSEMRRRGHGIYRWPGGVTIRWAGIGIVVSGRCLRFFRYLTIDQERKRCAAIRK